jgi:GPH family glycoside/pentoside/hexuronide:cation symporter
VSGIWAKIGAGVGGALIGWLLSFGGYDGAAAAQNARAQNAICAIYLLIPLIAAAATFVLMALYDLDKKYDGILASMKASANNDMPGREAA